MLQYNKIYRALNNTYLNNSKITKSDRRIKSCLSKMGYDTEFEAEIQAARNGQRAYECNYCNHWHIASKGK